MSSKVKGKWIVVDNVVYDRLKGLGRNGETFSDIVSKLIDAYELRAQQDEETDSISTPKE